jgi:hypothetical protein
MTDTTNTTRPTAADYEHALEVTENVAAALIGGWQRYLADHELDFAEQDKLNAGICRQEETLALIEVVRRVAHRHAQENQ